MSEKTDTERVIDAPAGTKYPTCSAWALSRLTGRSSLRLTPLHRLVLFAAAADADAGLHDSNGYAGTILGRLAELVGASPIRTMDVVEHLQALQWLEIREDGDGPYVIRLPERFLQYMTD